MRPDWDQYFLKLAMLASERATCPRMHCGCVLVKHRNVIATGYNGSIPGDDHCEDVGCLVIDNHCVRTNHAEMNALMQAARHGNSVEGATAYVTTMPCTTCAKALIASGISRVVIFSEFHDTLATDFFAKAGITIDKVDQPPQDILFDMEKYTSIKKKEA
ncbi:MAG: deoxycytidylate deaminase [Candidatus Omnitrophota bacterium]